MYFIKEGVIKEQLHAGQYESQYKSFLAKNYSLYSRVKALGKDVNILTFLLHLLFCCCSHSLFFFWLNYFSLKYARYLVSWLSLENWFRWIRNESLWTHGVTHGLVGCFFFFFLKHPVLQTTPKLFDLWPVCHFQLCHHLNNKTIEIIIKQQQNTTTTKRFCTLKINSSFLCGVRWGSLSCLLLWFKAG